MCLCEPLAEHELGKCQSLALEQLLDVARRHAVTRRDGSHCQAAIVEVRGDVGFDCPQPRGADTTLFGRNRGISSCSTAPCNPIMYVGAHSAGRLSSVLRARPTAAVGADVACQKPEGSTVARDHTYRGILEMGDGERQCLAGNAEPDKIHPRGSADR